MNKEEVDLNINFNPMSVLNGPSNISINAAANLAEMRSEESAEIKKGLSIC